MMDYSSPARARATDPETSHEAAASLSAAEINKLQEDVLRRLRKAGRRGLTDLDLDNSFPRYRGTSTIRSRRAELAERGLVMDSGRRMKLAGSRRRIVWVAAEFAGANR